jgi:hypothetical protein
MTSLLIMTRRVPSSWQLCFKIDLGQDKLIDTNNPVCFGNYHASSNVTGPHKWTRTDSSGTTTLTETGSSLTVQKEGVYKAEASVATASP